MACHLKEVSGGSEFREFDIRDLAHRSSLPERFSQGRQRKFALSTCRRSTMHSMPGGKTSTWASLLGWLVVADRVNHEVRLRRYLSSPTAYRRRDQRTDGCWSTHRRPSMTAIGRLQAVVANLPTPALSSAAGQFSCATAAVTGKQSSQSQQRVHASR